MPKGYGLSEATKDGIWELRAEGLSDRQIGRRLGLARPTVSSQLARTGGIRPRARRRPEKCLTLDEREEISARSPAGARPAPSPGRFDAPTRRSPVRSTAAAAGGATAPTKRTARLGAAHDGPRPTKLEPCPQLRRLVSERLREDYSPEQIADGSGSSTPTMRRCGSLTRRSTAPSTSRRGGR